MSELRLSILATAFCLAALAVTSWAALGATAQTRSEKNAMERFMGGVSD
jgi:hypothetical protein